MLRDAGMKSGVDAETFTACARRVAESYASAPNSHAPEAAAAAATKAAQLLATHLAAKADELFAPHLFHTLGAIAFVPAHQVRHIIVEPIWHSNQIIAVRLLAAHLAAQADELFALHLFHTLGAIVFVLAIQVRQLNYVSSPTHPERHMSAPHVFTDAGRHRFLAGAAGEVLVQWVGRRGFQIEWRPAGFLHVLCAPP